MLPHRNVPRPPVATNRHYNNSGIANVVGPDGVASGNLNSMQISTTPRSRPIYKESVRRPRATHAWTFAFSLNVRPRDLVVITASLGALLA